MTATSVSTSVNSSGIPTVAPSPTFNSVPASGSINSSPGVSGGRASGISVRAKAGVGIGVGAALIAGLLAGWFFFGRRRNEQESVPVSPGRFLYSPDMSSEKRTPVIGGDVPARVEVDATVPAYELEGQ